jgi:hypothetical protein
VATEVIKSIKPGGGGDYTNLTDWEDARRGDIVTGNTIEIAECYGGDCANAATISFASGNWTTDSDHYIVVRAAAGEKHEGTYDASKARIGDGSTGAISSSVPYTYVEDMIIYTAAGGGGTQAFQALNQSGIIRADRLLFRGCKNYFLHPQPLRGWYGRTDCPLVHSLWQLQRTRRCRLHGQRQNHHLWLHTHRRR